MKLRTHLLYVILLLLNFSSVSSFAANKDNNANQSDSSSLIVQTKQGKVRGTFDNDMAVWRGIRYAKAPAGDLRFRVPQPVENWTGVKDAVAFGPVAPQSESNLGTKGAQSEDCLLLNIWSPAADGKKRPVMFWIHGGGFEIGSGSSDLYYGANLAKKGDVVVVTINYRLGPLGFLYFKNAGNNNHQFENNLGIRDQIAALQWVKENIAAFGGDPAQVTIFGESAGGTSVQTLLATRVAQGLFKGAISESGPPAILWSPEIGEKITNKYCSILRINPDSLQLLKNVPVDTLKEAQEILRKYMVAETNEKVFSPTIDGDILTGDIFKCMKPEIGGKVALMIGTNMNESTMFASKRLKMAPRTSKELEKYFDAVTTKEEKEKVLAAYSNYPRKSGVTDILTDAIFRVPAIRLAECRSTYSSVYMYRFEWTSFALNVSGLKSFHGLEIPFVFGNEQGKLGGFLKVIATQKLIARLSGEMQQAWINFARYGNPNGTGAETWKPYSAADRSTMIFNKKSHVVQDPNGTQRAAWQGVKYY